MKNQRLLSLLFAAVLHAVPAVRVVAPAICAGNSPFVILLKITVGAAALLGSVDAVSGASTIITSPTNATGKVGQSFSYRITTGPDAANRFRTLPYGTPQPGQEQNIPAPGIALTNETSGYIVGVPTTAGVYSNWMIASDGWKPDRTISNQLIITIADLTPPSIVTPPASQTVAPGATVTMSVVATSAPPITYRWQHNGLNIFGATNATLTLSNVQPTHAGTYTVLVTGPDGTTSTNAELVVTGPPVVIQQPQDQYAPPGGSASFLVRAAGSMPQSFQWYLNGEPLPGKTSSNLALSNIQSTNAGAYSVVVSNALGTSTSAVALLRISYGAVTNIAPLFQLTNIWRYNQLGLNLGTAWREFDYDDSSWPSGAGVLAQEDSANALVFPLIRTTLSLSNGTQFVTNFYFRTHFAITNLPRVAGLNFSNLIDDGAVVYLNGTEIWRSTNMPTGPVTCNTFATAAAQEGVYFVTNTPPTGLVAGDNVLAVEVHQVNATSSDIVWGLALSALIATPNTAPLILTQPVSQVAAIGTNVTFSVSADGTGPLAFQWYKNGSPIPGAMTPFLMLNNVNTNNAGNYTVVVSNAFSTVTSRVATLSFNLPPPAPVMTNLRIQQNLFTLSFPAEENVSYILEYRDSLTSGSWQVLTNHQAGAAGTVTCTNLITNPRRFYRLRAVN